MENVKRIKLSSDRIFDKAYMIAIISIALYAMPDIIKVGGLTLIGGIGVIMLCIVVLLSYFTKPHLYYDEANLYIKKNDKTEITVPFVNIKMTGSLIFVRGSGYYIDYMDSDNEQKTIKFFVTTDTGMTDFYYVVKNVNPGIKSTTTF